MSSRSSRKKKRTRAQVVWKRWVDWRKIVIAVCTGIFVAALLTVPLIPDKVAVKPGELATEDIFATRYVRYPDYVRTEHLRELVAKQVPRVYQPVANADSEVRGEIRTFFETALELRKQQPPAPLEAGIDKLARTAPNLAREHLEIALRLSPQELSASLQSASKLAAEVMRRSITQENLEDERAWVRSRTSDPGLAAPANKLVREIVATNLIANQHLNEVETEQARRRERERVATQYEIIQRGDLIARKGEAITDEHLSKLVALGLVRERVDIWTAVSLILLAFGLVAVFCLYLYQFHPMVLRSFNELLLISVVVCGSLLLYRLGSTALGLRFSGEQLGFIGMVCSALGAMLIAALLCPQIAVFVGVALALLTSVQVGAELKFAILSIVSSLVGVQAVSQIRNREGILRACFTIAIVNAVTALVAHGATEATLPNELAQISQITAWAAAGGISSVMLFVLFAAWLERPFRLTTHLTLLELSDPSHPLLRRLQMEAPGTYHHSIIVGNLSEAAAEAIGADGLFCRVSSLYHDVGKVVRPHFFIENQSSENLHDNINPSLSSLIVTSHVKDGVELAEEYRLPPPLISIIREHHGTCLIKYFYHRAVTTGEEATTALEFQFRYEGPRPQTKESGIIMVADSVEAASRTLDKPTPGRIRDLIERIVRDRLTDGQFDECELTFKDLEKIVTSMTRSLTSLLHARIEYPVGDTAEMRRLAADGAAAKEPVRKALSDTPEAAPGHYGRPVGR